MDTATALQTPEILDLIQTAKVPVPIEEFRLLPDCESCLLLAEQPATAEWHRTIRAHVILDHRDLVIVSSD